MAFLNLTSMIEEALQFLDSLKAKFPEWAREAILQNSGEIVNLVKFGQLSRGLNSDGQPLAWEKGTGYYKPLTQIIADMYNVRTPKQAGAPYNFSWSGETLDNMYIDFVDSVNNEYDIETVKFKERLLESVYGEIFKLTKEHNDYVNKNIIEPFIADELSKSLSSFV